MDWRGRFIYDQAAAIAARDIDVLLWAPPGDLPRGVRTALSPQDERWLASQLDRGGVAHLLRNHPVSGILAGLRILRQLRAAGRRISPDVYHINWLQNALALPNDGRPALVTVLGADFNLLRLPGMAFALRRQFARRRIQLAPNAAWMVPRLEALFGDVATISAHPFGVSPAWFSVERRPAAGHRHWLVVSRITKGKIGTLLAWGEGLFSTEWPLRLLGPMQESLELPDWIENPGSTTPSALQGAEFPDAAGLITLSQHTEGRPQVLIEAMAAGLPVIASRIPAHEDLIRHGETGWLVDSRVTFSAALSEAGKPEVSARVGAAARAFVKTHIGTWDDCGARYVNAYHKLLQRAA